MGWRCNVLKMGIEGVFRDPNISPSIRHHAREEQNILDFRRRTIHQGIKHEMAVA